jgi:hypothetical protein
MARGFEARSNRLAFRATHPLPTALSEPPATWEGPYAALARADHLAWTTVQDAFAAVRGFLDPVLSQQPVVLWNPGTWTWSTEPPP